MMSSSCKLLLALCMLIPKRISIDVSFLTDQQTSCTGAGASDTCTMTCDDTKSINKDYYCLNAGTCIVHCTIDTCLDGATIDATSSNTLFVYSSSAECYRDVVVTAPNHGSAYFLPDPAAATVDEKLFKRMDIVAGSNTELIHIECARGDTGSEDCRQVDVDARTAQRLEITGSGIWAGDNGNIVQCPQNSIYGPQPTCIIDIDTVNGGTFTTLNGIPDDVLITSNTMSSVKITCNSGDVTKSGTMDDFIGSACWQTLDPTNDPTLDPTTDPSRDPTTDPTLDPTQDPTRDPTRDPTHVPTTDPTQDPTQDPTRDPTVDPTHEPTSNPSVSPTGETTAPTKSPTSDPTKTPSEAPTQSPSTAPSASPTTAPTRPAGAVDDDYTTTETDEGVVDQENEKLSDVSENMQQIWMFALAAASVVVLCSLAILCVWRYKKSKSKATNIKTAVNMLQMNRMERIDSGTCTHVNSTSNEIVTNPSSPQLEEAHVSGGFAQNLSSSVVAANVLMDDVVHFISTPRGPAENDSTPPQNALELDDGTHTKSDEVDDEIIIIMASHLETANGNQLLQEGAAVNDDGYMVYLGHNEGPTEQYEQYEEDEDEDEDEMVMDFMGTPMGNGMDDFMGTPMGNDIDEIENGYNDEEDIDVLNDVNAVQMTKGNDDYGDVILEKGEFLVVGDNEQNIEFDEEGDYVNFIVEENAEEDDGDILEEMNTNYTMR